MQAFDEACKRCAEEIEAGDFDLLFANSSIGYHVPLHHAARADEEGAVSTGALSIHV